MFAAFDTLGSSHVHLDSFASNFSIIHAGDTGLGLLSGGEREEGKTFSQVVEVGHLSKLLSSLFEVFIFGFLVVTYVVQEICRNNLSSYRRYIVDEDLP